MCHCGVVGSLPFIASNFQEKDESWASVLRKKIKWSAAMLGGTRSPMVIALGYVGGSGGESFLSIRPDVHGNLPVPQENERGIPFYMCLGAGGFTTIRVDWLRLLLEPPGKKRIFPQCLCLNGKLQIFSSKLRLTAESHCHMCL